MCFVHARDARINIHGEPKDITLVIGFINVELLARTHMLLSHTEIDFECARTEVNYQLPARYVTFCSINCYSIITYFYIVLYIIKINFDLMNYTVKSQIHNG